MDDDELWIQILGGNKEKKYLNDEEDERKYTHSIENIPYITIELWSMIKLTIKRNKWKKKRTQLSWMKVVYYVNLQYEIIWNCIERRRAEEMETSHVIEDRIETN